jgi:hypothetical protein
MYNPSTLEASQDTGDCLARRADASPYFAMRQGNVDMSAKLCLTSACTPSRSNRATLQILYVSLRLFAK